MSPLFDNWIRKSLRMSPRRCILNGENPPVCVCVLQCHTKEYDPNMFKEMRVASVQTHFLHTRRPTQNCSFIIKEIVDLVFFCTKITEKLLYMLIKFHSISNKTKLSKNVIVWSFVLINVVVHIWCLETPTDH